VDSLARVTADEERVLHVDWTEINLCKIVRFAAGIKNFICECEEFVFNAFVNLEPVKRLEDRSDTKNRSFNHNACQRFLDLLEVTYLKLKKIIEQGASYLQ